MIPFLGFLAVMSPCVLVASIAIASLFSRRLHENTISTITKSCVIVGLIATVTILGYMLVTNNHHIEFELGDLVVLKAPPGGEAIAGDVASGAPHEHVAHGYHFHLKFVFDRLSIPMAIMSYILCGTIGAFGNVYLHRESGYQRFFLFFSFFLMGMVFACLAFTIETLFLGWEMVGLSSALLVAYFHERPSPVGNGQRVWTVYRVADAAFLTAAILLHHLTSEGDFTGLLGKGDWPGGQGALTSEQALIVGTLLLVAAAGKSALIPFSGWLPRAMEGPTPSSAVFYGALSVHLGAFLLLRVSPLLESSMILCGMIVALGTVTAIYAVLVGRSQTDVKSALAFASLTQVSIIVVEIGLGFRYIALIHLLGHAFMRSLQLLRAPTLLRDYKAIENAIGTHVTNSSPLMVRFLPQSLQLRAYRIAMERGYLDAILNEYIVGSFLRAFRKFDSWERAWTDWLTGSASRSSDRVEPYSTEMPQGTEMLTHLDSEKRS